MKYLFTFFCLLGVCTFATAQNSDEELAAQYYADGDFEKAEILYKKLLKKDESSVYIYQNYFDCLLKMKSFQEAEKMVGRQIKHFPNKPFYSVDLGFLYSQQNDEKRASILFDDLIKNLGNSIPETEQLAMAFLKRQQYDYAILTYLKGRKNLNNAVFFAQNLVDLYYQTKNFKGVVDECLELLENDGRMLDLVQSKLIILVDQDIETTYLQDRVSLYLQKNPQKIVFDDLIMWVFVQQKKFNAAMRQAYAMDKRTNSDGRALVNLAQICVSNQVFDVAVSAYQKVLDFGTDGYYYMVARMGLLDASFMSLQVGNKFSELDLDALIINYQQFIQQFGNTWNTAPTVKQLADIYVFYKHDLDKGLGLLEGLIQIPRLQPHLKGNYKLALGDVYLIRNEVWDAALLYGQVDKDFKEDPLGQEAKFRNARLSYFQGNFDWAKDQLDVLKTATSQLISNNAIELSLTIQDNIGLDSNTAALAEFADAQLLLFQNKYTECLTILNMIPFKYPKHSLEDEIYYTKALVMEQLNDFTKAEEFYTSIITHFSDDILADNAVYKLGLLYQNKLNNNVKAIEMYEKLIFNYSGSLFVVDARKRYKQLKAHLENKPIQSP